MTNPSATATTNATHSGLSTRGTMKRTSVDLVFSKTKTTAKMPRATAITSFGVTANRRSRSGSFAIAQLPLQDLPARVSRQVAQPYELGRHLVPGQPGSAVLGQVTIGGHVQSGPDDQARPHDLTPMLVR